MNSPKYPSNTQDKVWFGIPLTPVAVFNQDLHEEDDKAFFIAMIAIIIMRNMMISSIHSHNCHHCHHCHLCHHHDEEEDYRQHSTAEEAATEF